jgi:hypothetical protein
MERGTSFHQYMEKAAKGEALLEEDAMYEVAKAYLKHNPLPKRILYAEHPMYMRLLDGSYPDVPEVWLRTTHDLVYEDDGGNIIARDYKTFQKAPTLDLDFDFQGQIYIAALMRAFPKHGIQFEYEYVRVVPPGTPNSKGVWTPDTCYLRFPVVISKRQADRIWKETQWVASRIREDRDYEEFWRNDSKSWNGCKGCFYKNICSAELEHGELDEQMLSQLTTGVRDPLELPSELPSV